MSIRSEEAGPIDPSKCAGTVEEGLGDFLRKGGFRWRSSDEPGDKIKGPQGGAGTPQSGARCSFERGGFGRVRRALGWGQRALRSGRKIW